MDPKNRNYKHLIEGLVEKEPEVVMENPIFSPDLKKEAEEVTDGDSRTTEADNKVVEKEISRLSDDFETIEDLEAYLNEYYPESDGESKENDSGVQGPETGELRTKAGDSLSQDAAFESPYQDTQIGDYNQNYDPTLVGSNEPGKLEFGSKLDVDDRGIDTISDEDAANINEQFGIDTGAAYENAKEEPTEIIENDPETVNAPDIVTEDELADNNDNDIDDSIEQEEIKQADECDEVENTKSFTMPDLGQRSVNFDIGAESSSTPELSNSKAGSSNSISKTPSAGMVTSSISPTSIGGGNNDIAPVSASDGIAGGTFTEDEVSSPSITPGSGSRDDIMTPGSMNSMDTNTSGGISSNNPKLPGGFIKPQQGLLNGLDLVDAAFSMLEKELRDLPEDYLEANGIKASGDSFTYQDVPLRQCDGKMISEIEKIVRE